ncbi:RagB/SusD family nutrient uptake outer membrane protein [Proteiniphilum sp. X52]|uniref:RagB/SusD family nutrient uptake outer membrane protein n=1 Tax=Proteiniphilum sp. X52 TaxID=2382159 RepID=UPI000F0A025B|nr:RagB/SusD family nutrient uptake outer membrane protein [Proteiniphilum sp. X52]RNC63841.1 RagB/SusD family nutrient uptake outer membrane protein [Proteiniphilum sp. X52]
MKIFSKTIVLCGILLSAWFTSCNFLDVDSYFEATFQQDSIFHSQANAEGYLWNTPTRFPDPGAIWGNSWTPGQFASDELTARWRTTEFSGIRFTVGEINERNVPSRMNIWYSMYSVIRRCNIMLANVDKVEDMNTLDKQKYRGYVHFLRGYAYYHLLMNWGPCLIVGDDVIPNSESAEFYDRERATYDESVDYICGEFGKAAKVLPTSAQQSINYFARPTKGAALALISRLRLYQASPLFNGGDAAKRCFGTWKRKSDDKFYVNQVYDPDRWAVAAAAAKSVIDMQLYELHTVEMDTKNPYPLAENVPTAPFPLGAGGIDPYYSYSHMFNGEGVIQTNKEFIWAHESSNVTNYTKHCFPVYYGGWGGMSVPQRVIDCYLMADGRDIHNASEEYPYEPDLTKTIGNDKMLGAYLLKGNVPKMYGNREARFYASIGFPGSYWPMNSASQDLTYSKRQMWFSKDDPSGITGAGSNINDYCVTGYVPVKYIHPDDSWADGKGNVKANFRTSPKPFPIIRYAEVLLEYVEALNNVEGSPSVKVLNAIGDTTTVTVTRNTNEMKYYFNMIRYRGGVAGVTDAELADKNTFGKILMNERQVELFNEGYRYFDTRRWGIYLDEDANSSNWRGLDVEKERTDANNNGGFWNIVTINLQNIRDRIAEPKMMFLPIPHDELLKVPAMDQNPGWNR